MTMAKRPNILWFCTDQQRFDTISALGYGHARTPTIDRLVRDGVAFTRAYAQSPICTPSRSSFLSGRLPSSIRSNRNGQASFPDDVELTTRLFADAGYVCGLIGKLHLASAERGVEPRADDGYAHWQYSHAPRDDWREGHAYAEWVRSKGESLNELLRSPEGIPADLHQTTWAAEKTMEFIAANRGKPWLASVNVYDPHPPFTPARGYGGRFDPAAMPEPVFVSSDLEQQEALAAAGIDFQSAATSPFELPVRHLPLVARQHPERKTVSSKELWASYLAMIALVDEQLNRILHLLEDLGEAEDTLLVFMSDHGEMLGDHGLVQKGCRFYEGLVRVPLLFHAPSTITGNRVYHQQVELLDVAPTLLEMAGLPVPGSMQGRSLAKQLRDGLPLPEDRIVRSEYYAADPTLGNGSRATMVFDGRYKLVVYHGTELGELYDLAEDPGEHRNLWSSDHLAEVRFQLLRSAFDTTVCQMDLGAPVVGRM